MELFNNNWYSKVNLMFFETVNSLQTSFVYSIKKYMEENKLLLFNNIV